MDADVLLTNSTEADGEVVWFRRLDAGVKLAGSIPLMTVTTKPITGKITKETVKTIVCGNAGSSGFACGD
jgi:hypothetical protein